MSKSFTTVEPMRVACQFSRRVLRRFFANKGLLLASAVSYNTLLSLIPLFALLLVVLSHVYDEQRLTTLLLTTLNEQMPGNTEFLSREIQSFLGNREFIGWIGFVVLVFFSSFAFRSLEDAFAVIFPRERGTRRLWISVVIPYAFIFVLGIGLLFEAILITLIEKLSRSDLVNFEGYLTATEASTAVVSFLGFLGLAGLLTCIYRFMPVANVRLRHAVIGGLVAAILWEITRKVLVWWFSSMSLVNVVYGSLATVVVALLTLEVAAIILLLGAQIIAELEPRRHEPSTESD